MLFRASAAAVDADPFVLRQFSNRPPSPPLRYLRRGRSSLQTHLPRPAGGQRLTLLEIGVRVAAVLLRRPTHVRGLQRCGPRTRARAHVHIEVGSQEDGRFLERVCAGGTELTRGQSDADALVAARTGARRARAHARADRARDDMSAPHATHTHLYYT